MERPSAPSAPFDQAQLRFSPRQQEVLELLLHAQSLKEIASALHISVNSAKGHVKTIYLKSQVRSARELIARHAGSGPPDDQFLASVCALIAGRTPREVLTRCLEALRIWTGAAETTVLAANSKTPPPRCGFVVPVPATLGAPGYVFWLAAPSGGWDAEAARATVEEVIRIAARCAAALPTPQVPPRSQGPANQPRLRVS